MCGAFDCNTGSNYCPEGVARRSYNILSRVGGCTFFSFPFLQYKSHACFLSFSLSFLFSSSGRFSLFSLTPRFSSISSENSSREIIEDLKFPTELVLAIFLASIFQFTVTSCVFIVVFLSLLCFLKHNEISSARSPSRRLAVSNRCDRPRLYS